MRLVLFLALFAGLVWPLTAWAVKGAAGDLKFDLPPMPRKRVLAAFALPFALSFILWQTLQDSSGLIIGSAVGLVLGLAAVWLFMRITPEEAPKTLGFSGTAFVAAIVISAGVLAGVNAIAPAAVKDSKTPTTLAMSPIVPGLPWVQPTPADSQPQPKKTRNTREAPTESVANSGGTGNTGGASPTGSDPFADLPPSPTAPSHHRTGGRRRAGCRPAESAIHSSRPRRDPRHVGRGRLAHPARPGGRPHRHQAPD